MPTPLQSLSDNLADAAAHAGRSTVAIHARRRIPSSGVVWRRGVVVAAHHTVKQDDDIRVTLDGGATARASVAGRDPTTDLVVLRLADDGSSTTPPPAEPATAPLRVGQIVLALGRPGDSVTASLGTVSALGGEWRTWQGGRVDQFVRLDLAIYDGFSGGPLVDAAGHVLGVNTSGLSRAAPLAIPAATVDRVVDQLLAGGHVPRGYLGVGTQPVRLPQVARRLTLRSGAPGPEVALMVVSLEPDGPADRAGLLLGDILLTLDSSPTADASDVMTALGPDSVGRPLEAELLRAGSLVTVTLTPGEHPGARRN